MLAKPEDGIFRSINEHNSELEVFCDWIEGSILFTDKIISTSDLIDNLIELHIYEDQDFASQFMKAL